MATYHRDCEQCGSSFTAGRRHARFCSSNCRNRHHRGKPPTLSVVGKPTARSGNSTPNSSEPTGDAGTSAPEPPAPLYDTLEDQVVGSLNALNALDTIAGRAAVRVAQQIDRGGDGGSAVVSLSKELSRLVTEAKAEAAPRNRDQADDIAALVNAKILRLVGEAG